MNKGCRMGDGFGDSFDVFFSYHWRDHAAVEAVARTLTERGLRVFLDRWYLTPGQPWPQALERTLACCNSVAVFLSADGLGPWQHRERDLALDRQGREPGFPVIPVLLTRSDPALGFLQLNTWVDLSSNVADQAALDFLCAAIRREPPGPPGRQQTCRRQSGDLPLPRLASVPGGGRRLLLRPRGVHRAAGPGGPLGSWAAGVVGGYAGLFPLAQTRLAGWVARRPTIALHSWRSILEPNITRIDRLAEINKLAGHLVEGTVALRDVAADVLECNLEPTGCCCSSTSGRSSSR